MDMFLTFFSVITVLLGVYLVVHALKIFKDQRAHKIGPGPLVDLSILGFFTVKGGRPFAIFIVGVFLVLWPLKVHVDLNNGSDDDTGRTIGWTIVGIVAKENSNKHDGVVVKSVPPTPRSITDRSGAFRIVNVRINSDNEIGKIAEIHFDINNDNYISPPPYTINKNNADISDELKEIRLKNPIILPQMTDSF